MRNKGLVFILLFLCVGVFAQQNLSVSLDNPVYKVLESLQVRALCSPLPTAKPYSRARVVMALEEALEKEDKLYRMEKDILIHYIDEFNGDIDYKWYQTGSYRYDSEKDRVNKSALEENNNEEKGEVVDESLEKISAIESEKKEVPVIFETGFNWWTDFNADAVSGDLGTNNFAKVFVKGSISEYFSFYFDIGGGVVLHEDLAYQPFLYKKSWTGEAVTLQKNMNHAFNSSASVPSGVYDVNPELSFSFWEEKFGFRFARIDRDWGVGKGNLLLSENAIPFSALEFYINPIEWFNVSTILGWLEGVGATDNSFSKQSVFQNMYAATNVEFFIYKYAYASAFSSAVFLKRAEGMYFFPGTMGSVTQATIGDFDNLQVGASVGFKYPGWFDIYLTMFFDEFSPTTVEAFLHKDRNMFSTQVSFNFEIPKIPFTSLNIQYTKIEPYMYTHPLLSNSPFYENDMSEHYINAEQCLGYYLQPNSDELKITLETAPYWFFNAKAKYSMIRHGVDVDGSDLFGTPLCYYNLLTEPLYNKNFLKDGIYEWFHTLGFEGEVDLRFISPAIPIKLGLGYYFVYKYHTSWSGGEIPTGTNEGGETKSKLIGGEMIYVNNSTYANSQQHIFSLSFKLF